MRIIIPKDQSGVFSPTKNIKVARVQEIAEEVAYWRKANAIHAWFVENVQDGNDDCREYPVEREKLQELLDRVNRVLAASKLVSGKIENGYTFENGRRTPVLEEGLRIEDATVAKELLPTQSGFFFGSIDYDKYYIEDLKYTKRVLEEVLQEDGEYYYQSSW